MEDGWISREMNINMKRFYFFQFFAARITLSPKRISNQEVQQVPERSMDDDKTWVVDYDLTYNKITIH